MKLISKELCPELKTELAALLRHQRLCWCALYGHDLDGFEPAATEAELKEHAEIMARVKAENAQARADGNKIDWQMPLDEDLFADFVHKWHSVR